MPGKRHQRSARASLPRLRAGVRPPVGVYLVPHKVTTHGCLNPALQGGPRMAHGGFLCPLMPPSQRQRPSLSRPPDATGQCQLQSHALPCNHPGFGVSRSPLPRAVVFRVSLRCCSPSRAYPPDFQFGAISDTASVRIRVQAPVCTEVLILQDKGLEVQLRGHRLGTRPVM